jgi:hypothetical protein
MHAQLGMSGGRVAALWATSAVSQPGHEGPALMAKSAALKAVP